MNRSWLRGNGTVLLLALDVWPGICKFWRSFTVGEQRIASTMVTRRAIAIALDFDGSLVAPNPPNLQVDLLRNHGNQAAA